MRTEAASSHKPFLPKWFQSFILLLSCLPDIGIAAGVNISCPDKVEKGDITSVTCVIDTNELDRKYACDSSSDRMNFTVNPTTSRIAPCSVQFLHNHFCPTLESPPGMCQCIREKDNVFTYQYFFEPSDEDMDAEIFCSIGCYRSSNYFLIKSDRCKVFETRPDHDESSNGPGWTDDENIKKMLAVMLKKQQENLLGNLDSVKSQLTSVQDTVKKAVEDIGKLQTRISSLEASNKKVKEKELNPGPSQPTDTLKSQDTFVKANDDNVDKRKPATMSERKQEKVPADSDSLKSKPTSVQGSLNKSDANISDRKSKTSLLYRKLKALEDLEKRASTRATVGKIITIVIGVIAILAVFGVVLRQTRLMGASSKNGSGMKILRPGCTEIKREKNGVEHELPPMSYGHF